MHPVKNLIRLFPQDSFLRKMCAIPMDSAGKNLDKEVYKKGSRDGFPFYVLCFICDY